MWKFCRDNKLLLAKGDPRPYNILMLDGGAAYVPYSLYSKFLMSSAIDISTRLYVSPLFMSEQPDDVFPFYIDHDMAWYPCEGERPYSMQQIEELARFYQDCMRLFLTRDTSVSTIAAQADRKQSAEGGDDHEEEEEDDDEPPTLQCLDETLTVIVLVSPWRLKDGTVVKDVAAYEELVKRSSKERTDAGDIGDDDDCDDENDACHEDSLLSDGDDASNDSSHGRGAIATFRANRPFRSDEVTHRKHDPVYVKQGLHFMVPGFKVDKHQALTMRESFIARFEVVFGKRKGLGAINNPLSSVIDAKVYLDNGLRMPYNAKTEKCQHDRSDDNGRNCTRCEGTGKRIDPSFYRPVLVVHGSREAGVLDEGKDVGTDQHCASVAVGHNGWPQRALRLIDRLNRLGDRPPSVEDAFAVLDMCRVRLAGDALPTRGWRPYAGCPCYNLRSLNPGMAKRYSEAIGKLITEESISEREAQDRLAQVGLGARTRSSGHGKSKGTPYGTSGKSIAQDDPLFELMLTLVRRKVNRRYGYVRGTTMFYLAKDDAYVMDVDGENSTYCPNVDRYHKSASVFFIIKRQGIQQGCRCTCPKPPNANKKCSEFWTKETMLITGVMKHFYPDMAIGPVASDLAVLNRSLGSRSTSIANMATMQKIRLPGTGKAVGLIANMKTTKGQKRKRDEPDDAVVDQTRQQEPVRAPVSVPSMPYSRSILAPPPPPPSSGAFGVARPRAAIKSRRISGPDNLMSMRAALLGSQQKGTTPTDRSAPGSASATKPTC